MFHVIGRLGAEKTGFAQQVAYLMSEKRLSFEEAIHRRDEVGSEDLKCFLQSEQFLQIQVAPHRQLEDLLATTTFFALKDNVGIPPLQKFLSGAPQLSKPRVLLLNDLDCTDPATYLGPLTAAFVDGATNVRLSESNTIKIIPGLIVIATSTLPGDISGFSSSPRYFLHEHCSSSEHLDLTERNDELPNTAIAETIRSAANDFLRVYVSPEHANSTARLLFEKSFLLPHGTKSTLRDISAAFDLRMGPFLESLWRDKVIRKDPSSLISSLGMILERALPSSGSIKRVSKIDLETRADLEFGPKYAKDCLKACLDEVEENADARQVFSAILDAVLSNGLLPPDMVVSQILDNRQVAWLRSEIEPYAVGSYIVPEGASASFVYLTPKQGRKVSHNFYVSSQKGRQARYKLAGYRFEFSDSRENEVYVPLAGFRKKSLSLHTRELADRGNAAVAFRSCFWLVEEYYSQLSRHYHLRSRADSSYTPLAAYVDAERKMHCSLHDYVRTNFKGEKERFYQYARRLLLLQALWRQDGQTIWIDEARLNSIERQSIVSPSELATLLSDPQTGQKIEFRKVEIMANTYDYREVMDQIGLRQLIFQGPPGTSKTFASKCFVRDNLVRREQRNSAISEGGTKSAIEAELEQFKLSSTDYTHPSEEVLKRGGWDIVQFHPGYSYEDFVRGISIKTEKGAPIYETVNKVFGALCALATRAQEKAAEEGADAPNFYLIVDEINRADLAEVFGELIYGLEYRGSKITTPYAVASFGSKQAEYSFEVPENIYIVGTMNTADRSTSPIDYALRRRFLFVDMPPQRSHVEDSVRRSESPLIHSPIELKIYDSIQYLFNSDEFFNDEFNRSDLRLGHTFFLRSGMDYIESFARRVAYQVIPILREYIHDGILRSYDLAWGPPEILTELKEEDLTDDSIARTILYYATLLGEPNPEDRTTVISPEVIERWLRRVAGVLESR